LFKAIQRWLQRVVGTSATTRSQGADLLLLTERMSRAEEELRALGWISLAPLEKPADVIVEENAQPADVGVERKKP
jgi:hypothetical protein